MAAKRRNMLLTIGVGDGVYQRSGKSVNQ